MERSECYENYPSSIPIVSYAQTIAIYVIGALVIAGFGIWWALFYTGFCVFLEITVLLRSCVHCYYHGKVCAFGRGKICAIFFKKGDPQKFAEKDISWYHLLPDFLVIIIPLVAGIVLLIINFTLLVLILILAQFILFFAGAAIIRGQLACKHCKQRELGCPAAKAFFKEE